MSRSLSRRLIPAGISPSGRWGTEEAAAVLDRLEASGLTVAEFADLTKLDDERLYRWRRKLGRGSRKAHARDTRGPTFIEIKSTSPISIEVVLRSGHVLRVPEGFGEEAVRRLVAVLEKPGSPC